MENNAAISVGRFVASRLWMENVSVVCGIGNRNNCYFVLCETSLSFRFEVCGTMVTFTLIEKPPLFSWEHTVHSRVWDLADPCFDPLEIVFWVARVMTKRRLGRRLWSQLRVHERRWVSERERSV